MKDALYLCKVDPEYLNFLRSFDHRVSTKGNNRPFVGVVVMVNGIEYILPLTSQTTKERLKRGKKKRPAKITTFIRDWQDEEIADILYNNMIPVSYGTYSIVEIDAASDTYESNEVRFIRKNKEKIIEKAKKVYADRIDSPDAFMVKMCCDFKLLEEHYKEFRK